MPKVFNFSFVIPDFTKVLIVLTNGYSGDSVRQPAQRLKNDGVIVYSIGVGAGVSNTELYEIASLPSNEHVFLLNSFQALGSFASRMSSTTCKGRCYINYSKNVIARYI